MPKGRPRQFNTEEALDQAVLVFWEKGYRGTSLDDLTEAMSINRPSLYAAFGDKEALFLQSVERYKEKMIVPNVRKLLAAPELRPGLSEFFKTCVNLIVDNETPPGCLIACLLAGECCESDAIKNKLADAISGADAAFARLFENHRKELKKSVDPANAGRTMTTVIHGMAIRARSGATKRTLMEIGDAFIAMITKSDV